MLLKNNIKLIKSILGNNKVLTSKEELYCYAQDSTNSGEDCVLPDCVVFVESIEEVQEILKLANKNKIPVVCRGAGTNMVAACTCPFGGIVLNFSRMNKVLEFNPINMTMRVQPGVILNDIKELALKEGLFYPPDPSNYKVSTIGGSIAQSSSGAKSLKYGTTKDYILSLKVVLADGTLVTLGANTIKDAVGYHLNQLIVGSEGTLAIVVEAELKLIPKPETRSVITAYFNSIEEAMQASTEILKSKILPSTIDFMDSNSIKTVENFCAIGLDTSKEALLIIELEGFESSMEYQKNIVLKVLKNNRAEKFEIASDEIEIEKIWTSRRSSFAATARLAPDVVSDDIIVPRDRLAELVIGCKNICKENHLDVCIVGHVGDGNIHPQVALDLNNDDKFKSYLSAKSQMYKLAMKLGGTISAEHGVGKEKVSYIENVLDKNSILIMKQIKKIFDPNNILNPGKIFK